MEKEVINENINTTIKANSTENICMPALALRGKIVFPNVYTSVDVGRLKSLNAVNVANSLDKKIFVVSQKDSSIVNPSKDDLYEVGTVCRIGNLVKVSSDNYRLTIEGLYRAKIVEDKDNRDYFSFDVQKIEDKIETCNFLLNENMNH